jgi:hypothetical protein
MLAFMLLFGALALTIEFIRKSRHLKKVNLLVDSALKNETEYFIQFNDKVIVFITDKVRTEAAWSNWNGYREADGKLVLFFDGYLYHNTSFSAAEIGEENLASLKSIVKKALPELEEDFLRRWYQL